MKTPAKLFLVDDHPMVREGLTHMLLGGDFLIAGEADSIGNLWEHPALPESDLVILDLALGEESGIALIDTLHQRGLAVLVYSMHERKDVILRALAAGADGYVTKREASSSLREGIQTVLKASRYLSPRAEKALGINTSLDALTGQQREIYRLLGQGLSNDEIAQRLGISVRTLESYCVRIMDKLAIQGIRELRRQAIRDATASVV